MPTTHPFLDDTLHEECGVFGLWDHPDASAHTALGLHSLQHRGQEAVGIVSLATAPEGPEFFQHTALGKVGDHFNNAAVMHSLPGRAAIGHVRYSTSGTKASLANTQPLFAELAWGGVAIAHNGNLTNAQSLKRDLVQRGAIFRTSMDTEVLVQLLALSGKKGVEDSLIAALRQVQGAYSLVVLTAEGMIGVRDPHGVRPLVLGKLEERFVLASETCAFDIIGASYVRDIAPGEMVKITSAGLTSSFPFERAPHRFCIFEYIYFARPDSVLEGKHVYATRKAMGRELAEESPVVADIVVPVPDSSVPAALGYAERSGLPFEFGIIRNHYVGRTFIEPTEHVRHLGVKLKHNANRGILAGKRVVLVDDSIVRGTTSQKIVQMVREAGAREVHMRISSPPTIHSCFYGVDTPAQENLLAHRMKTEEMAAFIGVDSLAFLSIEAVYRAVGEKGRNPEAPQYCDACFTGDYPIRTLKVG